MLEDIQGGDFDSLSADELRYPRRINNAIKSSFVKPTLPHAQRGLHENKLSKDKPFLSDVRSVAARHQLFSV